MRKVKKIVAIILSVCMMFSVIPVDTYAAESSPVVTQDDASTETDQLNAGSNDNAADLEEPDPNAPASFAAEDKDAAADGNGDAANTEDSINAASVDDVGEQSETYVAQINDTQYTDLWVAFENLNEGKTLKLLEDVYIGDYIIEVQSSGTLDLNGKKLTGENAGWGVLYFGTAGVNFTIEDSSEGKTGVIENTCANPDSFWTQAVQIDCSEGSVNLTISGGTFNSTGTYAVYGSSNGTLTINGGSFEKAIYISGGKCLISGGTFKTDISDYVPAGYWLYSPENNIYVVVSVDQWTDDNNQLVPKPDVDATFSKDVAGAYLINSLDELKMFAKYVNTGTTFKNKTVKLNADINMSDITNWEPISKGKNVFQGTFDGQNKTISNLKIHRSDSVVGLFATTEGKVQNIKFHNVDVYGENAAAVVGRTSSAIENVHLTGVIKIVGCCFTGGIVGNGYGLVNNCSVIADENSDSYVKGDNHSDPSHWTIVGGIRGFCGEGNVITTNVTVKNIAVEGYSAIGGIIGNLHYSNTIENATIENCAVRSTQDSTYAGNVGGIIGRTVNGNAITIKNCKMVNTTVATAYDAYADKVEASQMIPFGAYNSLVKVTNIGALVSGTNYQTFDAALEAAIAVTDGDNDIYLYGDFSSVTLTVEQEKTLHEKDIRMIAVHEEHKLPVMEPTGIYMYKTEGYVNSIILIPTYVAKIGTKEYTSLAEAVAAVTTGQTIKLLSDVTLEENLTIAADKNFTLDLCGNTLTAFNDNNKRILIDGSVEVKNGTIADGTAYDAATENTAAMIRVRNHGSLTIANSAEVTGSYYLIFPSQNAKLVVNGKVYSDNGASAVSTNGSNKGVQDYTSAGVSIVVNDGAEITSGGEAGIYLPSGTLTVNGGSITGQTGIAAKGGFIKINNGVITGTGANSGFVHNNNGWNNTGDALAVESSDYPYSPVSVQVTGGQFVSTNAKAVATYSSDAGKYETATKFISGGIFSTEVDAGYIADGYEAKPDNGMYKVVKKQLTIASDVEQSENKNVAVTTDNSQTAGTAEVKKDDGQAATAAETAVANKINTQVSADSANLVDLSTATKSVEETITAEKIEGLRTSTESTVNAAALDKLIKGAANSTVDFEVRSYVKTEVVKVETDENNQTLIKGIKVNMTPYYNVYAKQHNSSQGEVQVYTADQILEVKEPVTVTMDVPEGYTVTGDITVLHIKEDGSTYTYTGKYDAATKKISFVNEHGFSEFYLTSGIDEALVMYTPVSGDARYFSTFAEALACVENDGDKITLLKDVALTADDKDGAATNCLAIANGKTFTIDLGGKTFTGRLNLRHGNVTVKNGNMENESQPLNVYGSTDAAASNYSVLTIDSTATITAKTNTVCMMQADGAKTYGAVINVNGKVIATNDAFKDAAIYISGNIGNDAATDKSAMTSNNIVNINGTVTGGNTMAIAMSGQATVNVNAGAEISGSTAIGVKRGVLNVADGTTISATGAKIDPAEANTNGSEDTGAAISVTSTYNNYGTIAVNVNGGTISSANNAAVYVGHSSGNKPFVQGATVSVNAGTLVSAEGVSTVYVADAIVGDAANYTKAVIPGTSTATFSSNVSEYAETGYETVANAEGKYVVAPKTFVVAVQSRIQGTDNTVTTVTGGGNITYGNSTTVSAPAVSGYTFVGWFTGYSKDGNGTNVSTDLSFTYTPSDDTTLTAVYALKSGQMFKLSVTGSKFKYSTDGGASWSTTQKSEMNAEFDANTVITLKFIGNTDETFRDWVNASDKIVSTDKDGYTFTLVCDTVLKAHYSDEEEGTALVSFKSAYGQVIAARTYSATDTISFPAAPSKMGSKFAGWSMSEEEIKASIAANRYIEVTPIYEASGEIYTVTVRYEGVEKEDTVYAGIAVGKGKILTAPTISGYTFSCWKNSEGTIVSTNEEYTIRPTSDVTYTAVYVTENEQPAEKIPTIVMTDAFAKNDGSNKVSFTANRSVPEGYEVVENGILYGINSSFGGEDAKTLMVLDGLGVYKVIANNNALNGTFTCNIPVGNSTSASVYARGYMILKKDNVVSYYYSDNILSGSFESLQQ